MKKLLYTLFAFALIVACEKDMDENYDSSSINPIEAEVSIDREALKLEIINHLLGNQENLTNHYNKNNKSSASTARTTCVDDRTDHTTNRLDIHFDAKADGSGFYRIIRDEVNDDAYSWASTPLIISFTPSDFPASAQILFNPPFTDILDITETNSARFPIRGNLTPADAGIVCSGAGTGVPLSDFYSLSAAPFPLTGVLATMHDNYATMTGWPGGTSAHYAGTTTQTVVDAIENDIRTQ